MNQDNKIRLNVDIYGNQYKLISQSSPDYMKRIAAFVDERMYKISKGYPRLDTQRIAVLAAVHIADELTRLREEPAPTGAAEAEELNYKYKAQIEELQLREQHLSEDYAVLEDRYKQLLQDYEAYQAEQKEILTAAIEQAEANAAAMTAAALEQVQPEEIAPQPEAREASAEAVPPAAPDLTDTIVQESHPKYESLEHQYKLLQEEYAKLQAEFNEWIQMMEPASGEGH